MADFSKATDAYVQTYHLNSDNTAEARQLARFSGLLLALQESGVPTACEGWLIPDVTGIADSVALEGDEKIGNAFNN